MLIFLDKVDTAPLSNSPFPFDFNQWVAVLVDTLNEVIQDVQDALNILSASSYTSAEITALDPTLPDGVLLYDTDLDVYVGKENGALVKFTTTPYP
jgi:hypothetical protein